MNIDNFIYCDNFAKYNRLKTRVVNIGGVPLGGNYPIRIQSMTTTDTMDTIATVEQSIRMVKAGCEYVRITAPSIKEAENLKNIKDELLNRGYNVPLIADIHFTPNAAEVAAKIVEKVRVNPGNYVDKKKFQQIEYSDAEYIEEVDRIKERFSPLVKICKEYGTAMRIGTNHGSLSDRIMSRYGDTPLGMVESALEFVRICEELDYHDIVLSMKASNTRVMVQAYRLLINKMKQEGMNYPLHLGVTEAGDGEDGRIKSAVGIGALLEDGIGDTIRVSLTEEPENEAPVAIMIADKYFNRPCHSNAEKTVAPFYNPFEYRKRDSFQVLNIGGGNIPIVVADLSYLTKIEITDLESVGYIYNEIDDKWNYTDFAVDYIFVGENKLNFNLPQNLNVISSIQSTNSENSVIPIVKISDLEESTLDSSSAFFLELDSQITSDEIKAVSNYKNSILVLNDKNNNIKNLRNLIIAINENGIYNPILIKNKYKSLSEEESQVYPSIDFGSLLIDGLIDGVWGITDGGNDSIRTFNRIMFGVLQAARVRISKTEYIACPSCGRTLFDLVEVTNKIRSKTSHLKGVKIGIMGCIVNGPGEMADADYGYVGSGPGKISLYKQKEVIHRNLPSDKAVDELINLIKENGDWVEPI